MNDYNVTCFLKGFSEWFSHYKQQPQPRALPSITGNLLLSSALAHLQLKPTVTSPAYLFVLSLLSLLYCLCCLYLIYPSPFLLVSYCLHLFSFCLIILLAYGFCLLILQTFLSCLPVLFLIELRVWLILVTLLLMFVLSGLTKQSEPEWCVCACLLISEVCVQDYLVSSELEVQLLQCH